MVAVARYQAMLSIDVIAILDGDYKELCRAVCTDPNLKASLNAIMNTVISFEEAWSVACSRFRIEKFAVTSQLCPNTVTFWSRLVLEKIPNKSLTFSPIKLARKNSFFQYTKLYQLEAAYGYGNHRCFEKEV